MLAHAALGHRFVVCKFVPGCATYMEALKNTTICRPPSERCQGATVVQAKRRVDSVVVVLQILHVLNPRTLEDLFGRPLPWQEEAFHLALVTRTTRSLSSLTGQAYPAYAGDAWMLLLVLLLVLVLM